MSTVHKVWKKWFTGYKPVFVICICKQHSRVEISPKYVLLTWLWLTRMTNHFKNIVCRSEVIFHVSDHVHQQPRIFNLKVFLGYTRQLCAGVQCVHVDDSVHLKSRITNQTIDIDLVISVIQSHVIISILFRYQRETSRSYIRLQ